MTQNTNYNGGGARQCPEYITVTIDADEFGAESATAGVLDIGVLPAGGIIVDVSLGIETAFNGGGNDTLDVGLAADADAVLDGVADNLGAAGPASTVLGVQVGREQTAKSTITATYTPAAAAATTGTVRINIGYIGADRADAVFDG